jgi:hypothetical protein
MSILSRRQFIHSAAALTVAGTTRAAAPVLSLATFTVEVTPPVGHPCMGGGIAPVKDVLDPLFAHGVILHGAAKPIAIVAVDWCELRNDAYDRWRTVLADTLGTTRECVLLSCLHQHDAPIADLAAQKLLDSVKANGAICMLDFHEQTVQKVAKAAKDANAKRQPVTHIGTGQAKVEEVASNRRYLDEAGKVQYNRMSATRDPKIRAADVGTIDPYLKTLSFWNNDTPLVALSAYATHPMSYYGRGSVSADFVGGARKLRQADEPKTLQIYLSGCSGNVTAGKYNDGSVDHRPVLAQRLHHAMRAAWKNTTKQPVQQCILRHAPLTLVPRTGKGFTEADLTERLKDNSKPFGQCLAALGLSWRQRMAAKQPIDVCALDFGSAVYLLLPAEAYVEYQLYAQETRAKSFVVVAGYGEAAPGYIPIERAWKENDSNLGDWCWIEPGSEPLMQAAIRTALGVGP